MSKPLAIKQGRTTSLPSTYKSLGEMLLFIAKEYPHKGMTFIDISGKEDFISYAGLAEEALLCLESLRQMGYKSGDTLILIINNNLKDFYVVFWACILAGIVVVPVSQPSFSPGSVTLLKLNTIWKLLKKPAVVIESNYQKYYQNLQENADFNDLHFLAADLLTSGSKKGVIHHSDPDELAILQFSSGSTGTPKGVQLSHRNIITNILAMQKGYELTQDDNVFTWLPHTHDMGMFFQYLSPMATGSNIYVFSPMVFTRAPALFLKKITKHKGTWFGSPNFGFDWMIKQVTAEDLSTLDLSSLRFILNGAEPISAQVMRQFCEKFASCGFSANKLRAAYGMAEATVCATVTPAGAFPRVDKVNRLKLINENIAISGPDSHKEAVEFVHVGLPIEDISVRIADQNGNTLVEDLVGEIQIKGPSVTAGYIYADKLNEELFQDEWLHTGDLGYMRDGSLVIVGRTKDLILVRGQNYFAHDLEEVLFKTGTLQRGNLLVIGNFNATTQQEELLVFVKHKGSSESFLTLRQILTTQLSAELGLEITHVIPVKTIPKTTSGKLQRFALLKCYLNGEFEKQIAAIKNATQNIKNTEAPQAFSDELEKKVREIWSNVLGVPINNISSEDKFMALGGNSIKAFQLLEFLSKLLQKEVDPEILVLCHTIKQTVHYLQSNCIGTDGNADNCLRTDGNADNYIGTDNGQNHERVNIPQNTLSDMNKAVAITGMALRFPSANTAQEFWNNLELKKDSVTQLSDKRKCLSGAKEWNEWMGSLEDIDCFDHEFFEISPEEAAFMDPQQRLVLETSYHALEDAGIILGEEQNIGVYSGVSSNTYYQLLANRLQEKGDNGLHPHALVGNLANLISARLSSYYNFTGPALSIDTACSSFLVALHHAVLAIRENEIAGAVVIGANILVTPDVHTLSRKAGILSSSPAAKVFDKDADGTVLGEGIVVFYLESLNKAIAESKNIYGVIRGSAINNDGTSFGIMSPSPKGQYQVLENAYSDANIAPSEVNYIEVHGTGTTIGDLVEVSSLNKLFSQHHKKEENSVGIGSVKTNIGHLLPAAGGAGLAKVLLCFKHQKLVPNLHFNSINKDLKLATSPFYVVEKTQTWTVKEGKTRKAGLSSFGLGGTNAHIVLEEWAKPAKLSMPTSSLSAAQVPLRFLTLSAKNEKALLSMINDTKKMLVESEVRINDLCFTRNRYRTHYQHRAAFLISSCKKIEKYFFGEKRCVLQPKIGVLIGDIFGLNHADHKIDLFSYWYQVCKNLQNTTKNIAFIKGSNSGEILALLLNEKHDLSCATSLYNEYLNSTDVLQHAKNNLEKLPVETNNLQKLPEDINNVDIVITLGNVSHRQFDCLHSTKKHISIESTEDLSVNDQIFSLMGKLYVSGADFEWYNLHPNGSGTIINIPQYPFDSKPFWIE